MDDIERKKLLEVQVDRHRDSTRASVRIAAEEAARLLARGEIDRAEEKLSEAASLAKVIPLMVYLTEKRVLTSRSEVKRLAAGGMIFVDGKRATTGTEDVSRATSIRVSGREVMEQKDEARGDADEAGSRPASVPEAQGGRAPAKGTSRKGR